MATPCWGRWAQSEFRPPFPVSAAASLLAVEMRHRGERVGAIYVGDMDEAAAESGQRELTEGDEELLVMFASQSAPPTRSQARGCVSLLQHSQGVSGTVDVTISAMRAAIAGLPETTARRWL